MVMGFSNGLMEEAMKDNGRMVNNTVKESIKEPVDNSGMVSGKMEED